MQTATVREVQHHLAKVLAWVEGGEQVAVTRRGQVVAVLSPPSTEVTALPVWPSFVEEMQAHYGDRVVIAKTAAAQRSEWERGDR